MNEEYIDNVKHLIEQKDADQVKELLADLHLTLHVGSHQGTVRVIVL